MCFISCSPCLIWSSENSWKVRYQNLCGRMCSLLYLSPACSRSLNNNLYLKLHNSNPILLLLPLLKWFLSSFSCHPPSFPHSPPSFPPSYVNYFVSEPWRSSLEAHTHWICFDIRSFITCLFNNKNKKSYIWQQFSVVYEVVFFCLVVCLILVWAIFVSVVWMYVS